MSDNILSAVLKQNADLMYSGASIAESIGNRPLSIIMKQNANTLYISADLTQSINEIFLAPVVRSDEEETINLADQEGIMSPKPLDTDLEVDREEIENYFIEIYFHELLEDFYGEWRTVGSNNLIEEPEKISDELCDGSNYEVGIEHRESDSEVLFQVERGQFLEINALVRYEDQSDSEEFVNPSGNEIYNWVESTIESL